MEERIYYIIKIIAETGLSYPYWGVLCNRTTKFFFEANEQIFLQGYWVYVCVKTNSYNIKARFDNSNIKPDSYWTNEGNNNIWYGWKIGEYLSTTVNLV